MPSESETHDSALSALISRRIDDGLLPVILSKTISVGFGSGARCLACDRPVDSDQVEYQAFGPRYGRALRLHWGCHILWQLECIDRMYNQRSTHNPLGQEAEGC